MTGVFRNLQSW